MTILILARHAKAASTSDGGGDIGRPLSAAGRSAAEEGGHWLLSLALAPDLVLCSPARRTRETLARFGAAIVEAAEVRIVEAVYRTAGDGDGDYRALLADEIGGAACCLLVGHNPMAWNTAIALAAEGDPRLRSRVGAGFPDGAIAVFDLDAPEARPLAGTLRRFHVPAATV